MITYKDKTFCSRKDCKAYSCPLNLAHVDWSWGLPVSVTDFSINGKCPKGTRTMDGGAEG